MLPLDVEHLVRLFLSTTNGDSLNGLVLLNITHELHLCFPRSHVRRHPSQSMPGVCFPLPDKISFHRPLALHEGMLGHSGAIVHSGAAQLLPQIRFVAQHNGKDNRDQISLIETSKCRI